MDQLANVALGRVEVIDDVSKIAAAAKRLATHNVVFLVPHRVRSGNSYVVQDEEKLELLITALDKVRPTWTTIKHQGRRITASDDLDMHGNPYMQSMLSPDFLHYHKTINGTVEATFAQAFQKYLDEPSAAKPILTAALRQGKTDPRYADPKTFQRVNVKSGDALVFRLSEERSGLPLLHDFRTTSRSRTAEITAIYRLD